MVNDTKKRRLDWTRDEIIVALDAYHRYYPPTIPSADSEEMRKLSDIITKLHQKSQGNTSNTRRSANSVHLKIMNFHTFNPSYTGKGLPNGSKRDRRIYREFENDRDKLSETAKAIKSSVESEEAYVIDCYDLEVSEGKPQARVHLYRERSKEIISKKKEKVLNDTGQLQCEGCGFEFIKTYGYRGDGFIECHHTKPVSEMMPGDTTTLDDLCLICSNCHRMIHRSKPWLTMDQLKELVQAQA